MSQANLTAVDLFCGAGGLTLGLKQAGFNVIAGVELNPVAAETYRLNHADINIYEKDIRHINPADVLEDANLKPGELDLLAGCPPCQGFSSQRTRNKTNAQFDPRNDLIFEFFRFVKTMLPKTIMLENVPALAKNWRILKLKKDLEELGYVVNERSISIHDAADYGVPQRRRRLLFKASRLGIISDAPKANEITTVKEAFSSLRPAGESGDTLHDLGEERSEIVKKRISLVPKNGGSRTDLPMEYWLECHKKNPGGYRDVYGRMRWEDVAPTITGGCHNPSKGRFIHPELDRAITLREAAILQTFPMSYQFSLTQGKDAVALMIGNALPPKFIEIHAREYADHLKEERQ
ncbi:MAG: DNA (cytosine-5-)-methyltransferase [Pseudomonas sp.]|nr:DNA (cytosine-5-)-methyltransferase [Pseudomonas sp.]MBB52628.1 DNA (cytosine-5-)-methyltransferase [Pseudomonadales bacterium]|tara:strand:- start:2449 stop:3495 length:1047 start_codon:yes stop_codon:yes gene_type:complete